MKCIRCHSENHTKSGFVNGNQRYKCKDCHYYSSVDKKSDVKTPEQRRLALELYLEGLGFRAIGRILKISYGTVYKWIKNFGEQLELLKDQKAIEVVELDEIHSYIGHKKTTVGAGLLLIDLENASSVLFVEKGTHQPLKNFGRSQRTKILLFFAVIIGKVTLN